MPTGKEIMEYVLALVMLVIGEAIFVYVLAYALPGGLTTLSTTAFTSVNAGTVFAIQSLTPLIIGFVFVLAQLAIIEKFV